MPELHSQEAASFWEYSVALYRRPGVEDRCLAMQDTFGANIDVLLYCVYVAQVYHRSLTALEVQNVCNSIAAWDAEVVKPLRHVRLLIKEKFRAVRGIDDHYALLNALREAELCAEAQTQRLIVSTVRAENQTHHGDPEICLQESLAIYGVQLREHDVDNGWRDSVEVFVATIQAVM